MGQPHKYWGLQRPTLFCPWWDRWDISGLTACARSRGRRLLHPFAASRSASARDSPPSNSMIAARSSNASRSISFHVFICGDIGDNGDSRMNTGFAVSPRLGTVLGTLGTNPACPRVSPLVPGFFWQVGTAQSRVITGCPQCPQCPPLFCMGSQTRKKLHAPCTILCTTVHRGAVRNPCYCTAPHHLPLGGGADGAVVRGKDT